MIRIRSVTKYLNENYGGNWAYDAIVKKWQCNDGKKYVIREEAYLDKFGNFHQVRYVLYDGMTRMGAVAVCRTKGVNPNDDRPNPRGPKPRVNTMRVRIDQ